MGQKPSVAPRFKETLWPRSEREPGSRSQPAWQGAVVALERSAGAVVFHRDPDGSVRYLLLQYGPGHWDFPRGNMEAGEREVETATREIREETAIKGLTFVPGFREESTWYYRREGKTIRKTATYLLAEAPSREVKISHEHTGYAWMSYENAKERVTFDNAARILRRAHAALGGDVQEPPPKGGRQSRLQ